MSEYVITGKYESLLNCVDIVTRYQDTETTKLSLGPIGLIILEKSGLDWCYGKREQPGLGIVTGITPYNHQPRT